MAKIVGVRFKELGKVYYFKPGRENLKIGDKVVAETSQGTDLGTVVIEPKDINDNKLTGQLKKILRIADENDIKRIESIEKRKKEALRICSEKIAKHRLDMKLIDVEYTFDKKKLLFYFSSDSRVDFRDLVKDLAAIFKTRIELRQIGVRDECKIMGGLGVCGRPFCCNSFLEDFQPVSIRMAKEQSLSLNPTVISGSCGRLMCCLKYEQEAYSELLKKTPKIGAVVKTPEGEGVVIDQNIIMGKLTVKIDKSPEAAPVKFNLDEVSLIRDAKIKFKNDDELEELKFLE